MPPRAWLTSAHRSWPSRWPVRWHCARASHSCSTSTLWCKSSFRSTTSASCLPTRKCRTGSRLAQQHSMARHPEILTPVTPVSPLLLQEQEKEARDRKQKLVEAERERERARAAELDTKIENELQRRGTAGRDKAVPKSPPLRVRTAASKPPAQAPLPPPLAGLDAVAGQGPGEAEWLYSQSRCANIHAHAPSATSHSPCPQIPHGL